MGSTPVVSDIPVVKAQVTVTLSPAIQQKLIQFNAPILSAIAALKELGLIDAAATLAAGKSLTSQTLSLSPMAARQLCQALSRVSATDSMATEVGALVNSIPPAMRSGRPGISRPMPTRVTNPMRAPKSAATPKVK